MVEYARFLDGIVHEPTQSGGEGFDLTVAGLHEVTAPGQVDFGGGELDPATTEPRDSRLRHPDDDYGWWELDAGTYLVEYNESITADGLVFSLQTRDELLARGAAHPTVRVTDLPRVPLTIGGAGLDLKKNARVSMLVTAESA
jgi:hypothetical protein